MRISKRGLASIERLLYKNRLNTDAHYRLSGFCFLISNDDICCAKNMLTQEIIELDVMEYDFLKQLSLSSNSLDLITDRGLVELVHKRYIVEESYDEYKHYNDILLVCRTIQKKPINGYQRYTILPTTGCNARCVYCYEEGMKAETMSIETADRLIAFILDTNSYKNSGDIIKLDWFGGEPLLSKDIITYICKNLSAHGIKYRSLVVTNGSLISPELVEEMKSVWNLVAVQLSVDGDRNDYNTRKAYINPMLYNYDTLIKSIENLADANISVALRCNVDNDNITRLDGFIKELKYLFIENKKSNVKLYFAPLQQVIRTKEIIILMNSIYDLYKRMEKMGASDLIQPLGKKHFRTTYCMADNMDSDVIIMPDGSFNNCDSLPDGHCWGNIFDGITDEDLYNELKKVPEADPECRYCTFLPECTAFRKIKCPIKTANCYEYETIRTKTEILRYYLKRSSEQVESDIEDANC